MNNLPFRAQIRGAIRLDRLSSPNIGLVYAKYPDEWEKGKKNGQEVTFCAGGPEKKKFFRRVGALMGKLENSDKGLLQSFQDRRKELLSELGKNGWTVDSAPFQLTTQWRFVSGLGIAHPFETGLVFDHTYGIPYLPGSSVKGAARALAEETGWEYPKCEAIFGPDDDAPNRDGYVFAPSRGYVVFFDAYPTKWPELELDIINPHYTEYYEGTSPPADWLSPVPTYFLAVKPGTELKFCVGVPPLPNELREEILDKAEAKDETELLREAVDVVKRAAQESGMGGKTAVGYGYFTAAVDSASDKKTR